MPVDEKVTQLALITDLLDTDEFYVVSDPGGTPISKTITKGNATKNLNIAGLLSIPVTEIALATDTLTATVTGVTVASETGTSDNLSTISGPTTTKFVLLFAKTGHTITVKHNTGNIQLSAKNDIILSEKKGLLLQYDGTNWRIPKLHGNGFNDDSDNPILAFLKVASAVNYLQVRNAATGGNVELDAIGTDTDIGFDLKPKGAGAVRVLDSSGNVVQRFDSVASAVNFIAAKNSATGVAIEIDAVGTDSNIDIKLVPKGTGVVYGNRETIDYMTTDESSAPTTGVKVTDGIPYDFKITDVQVYLTTPGSGGTLLAVDVLYESAQNSNSFSTIFSTKPTIDAGEYTSVTAATPPVLSTTSLSKGRRLQYKVDTLDSGVAARGIKIMIIGYPTAK